MPPRKKLNSSSSSSSTSSLSSKKSTQNLNSQQPTKYGIQHFFQRHSLSSSQKPKSPAIVPDDPNPNSGKPEKVDSGRKLGENGAQELKSVDNGVSVSTISQNPKIGRNLGRFKRSGNGEFRVPRSQNPNDDDNDSQNPKNGRSGEIRVLGSSGLGTSSAIDVDVEEEGKKLGVGHGIGNVKEEVRVPKSSGSGAGQLPKNGMNLVGSQNTPPENLLVDLTNSDDVSEVSPQVSKSMPRKRFKFSPGMIIKQSQDDGGEEVTWKISPVNERLQAISKLAPDVVKALADASRLNSCSFQQLSDDTNLHGSEVKVDNVHSLPTVEVPDKSPLFPNKATFKRVSQGQDMNTNNHRGNDLDLNDHGALTTQSPFRTPPSLSYRHDKPVENAVRNNGLRECSGLRQHKKALLELLDQVENAISVEEPQVQSSKVCDRRSDEQSVKATSPIKETAMKTHEEVDLASSEPCFLVLEVTDKRGAPNSNGAQCSMKVLRVLNEQNGEELSVHLWDDWFYSVIEPGDTIRVIGEFDLQGNCDVNHEKNLLIVHPNLLLSGTRVAGSFSCSRRAVLDDRLKSSEYSTAALIGTLLHQIFQAGLLMDNPTIDLLQEFSKIALQKNVEGLFACGEQENDVKDTLNEAIPKLCSWISLFRPKQKSKAPTVDFGPNNGLKRVSICDVVDIEEMAWAPKYGLKGVIDASIRVKVHSSSEKVDEKIMPLEFKTGKATSGQSLMEHSAQLILYTLLMSERYSETIDSGLLYYLSTDQTLGTLVRRSDLIGLIMRRNELAHDIIKVSMAQQLPPMLKSPNMCKGCRQLNACTIYHKVHGGSAESSGLESLFDSLTDHLTTSHKVFFKQWDRLIDLEAKELQLPKSETRRAHDSKNESSHSFLSSIVLDASDELHLQTYAKDNRFVYRFVRKEGSFPSERRHNTNLKDDSLSADNDLDCTLRSGDRVILSAESVHIAVASGIITDISRSHVSVSFSKRLRLPRSSLSSMSQDLYQEVWRIERDEVATSFATMRFNLVQLFLQSTRSSHLRKLIVDLEAPRFDSGSILSQDPAISYIWSERNLNDDQRRAIIKILTAKDYALILGMPGTGKTSTMVYAVKALLMRGASILLTSYTNSAVDNLLIKLKAQGIDFARIGRCQVVHKEVQGHCLSGVDIQSVEEIKLKLEQVKVVAVTCLGITSPLLANKKFDVCIIDEAGQTNLPVSLGPLMFASMFVLVGDHYQLPPLVKSAEARESGMSVSLFRRLSEGHPQAISALQSQYRMCAGIMKLSNALIYDDRLRCGSPNVENAKLKLSIGGFMPSWLKEVLDANKPVIFIDTDILRAYEKKDQKTVNNPIEAHIVAEVTAALANHGVDKEEIGIITPYNSQAKLIQHVVNMTSVEVHTIDKYQGRDKDCILVSFVRSAPNPRNCSSSLLGDWHRINVALTRAKKKLIMVGARKTLSKVPLLKLLIEKVEEQSGIFCITRGDIECESELKRCSQARSVHS